MTNNSISLYIHIPFCAKKCNYCAFYSLPDQDESTKQAYFEALMRQISFFECTKKVSTVYFGGGTPPMLGIERLCKLVEFIATRFVLTEDCEITVEVNPGTVDFDSLSALKKSGANRLSIGVQAANDKILHFLGRIHDFEDAKKCIADARAAGFDNISADLIFALPKQNTEEFITGAKMIMSTGIDHLSAYSLQVEEGTPIYEKRSTLDFPDEDCEEEQYELLCKAAAEKGFRHYEISSYAKSGFESKHNMNYWACGEYFGFGAGAHSFYNGRRFSAKADIKYYILQSYTSLLAPTDYDSVAPISASEAEEERIMLGLRTANGARIPERAYPIAERIAKLGYGRFEDGILALNSKGFRVSNEIIAEILT